jgi:hypothetical protein
MIRRPAGSEVLLITQDDHAIFSGFLAGHIGNDRFARPSPDAVTAISRHDAGWPLHDDQPTLNAARQPLHVFETPATLAVRIWSASADRAEADGPPAAALLVSLHQLNLSDFAMRQPRAQNPRDRFELNKFQHREVERQERLRRQLGLSTDAPLQLGLAAFGRHPAEDLLRFHFRLLTLCDRLSLSLCCGKDLFPSIDDVHPRPSDRPMPIRTRLEDDATLTIDPWPFDLPSLAADVPCRRVRAEPFDDEAAFQAAYAAAPVESLTFRLEPVSPAAGHRAE